MIKIFVQYGIFTLVGYAILYLFSFIIEMGVKQVDNMIVPCQHGTVFIQGKCRCDGTPFDGTYCSACTCEHGFCSTDPTTPFISSDYGCRCPSLSKRFGFLCDLCNTIDQENCTGTCNPEFFGLRCEKICYADLIHENNNSVCNTMRKSGGHCSTCHGHGTCEMGECKCDKNWFDEGLIECVQTCPGNPMCSGHGVCEMYGNTPGCLCEDGWNGVECDLPCPGVIETGKPCNDNGVCNVNFINKTTTCECLDKFRGEACEIECPGDIVICNGHGTCDDLGVCTCDTNVKWSLPSCRCSDELTCNLNGECDDEETCVCFGNSGGDKCLDCKDNWHGNNCDLYCNPYLKNNTSFREESGFGCYGHGTCLAEDDSISCTCNLDTVKRMIHDGAVRDFFSYYDTKTNCAECEMGYFPKQQLFDDYGAPDGYMVACENKCEPSTCNHHGICNENFGTPGENLCSCDLPHVSDDSFCTECDEHWYPLDLSSEKACNRFCIASGDLPDECDGTKDCVQCSGHGSCTDEGICLCDGTYTGDECQILCTGQNGLICGGHGKCESNEIQILMEHEFMEYGNIPLFTCTCDPQDPVDADSRIDWDEKLAAGLVNGTLDPPPNPEYFGETCDFACTPPPWEGGDVCNGLGNCTISPIRTPNNQIIICQTDSECHSSITIQQITSGDATWTERKGPFCHKLDDIHGCNKSTDDCYEILLKQRPKKMRSEECVSNSTCYATLEAENWYNYCVEVNKERQPEIFESCKSVVAFCPAKSIPSDCKSMVNFTDGKDVSYKLNFLYEYDKKHYPFLITEEYRSNESTVEHDEAEVAFSEFNHSVDLHLTDDFCLDYKNRYPIITTVRENRQYLCNGIISNNTNCSGTLDESQGIFYNPFIVSCNNFEEAFTTYGEAMLNRPTNCKIIEQEKDLVYINGSGTEHIDTMCNEMKRKFPSCTYPEPCDFNPCSGEDYSCENKGSKAICSTTNDLNSTCLKGISERLTYSSYSCDINIPETSCPNEITHNVNVVKHCKDNNPVLTSILTIGDNETKFMYVEEYIHFKFRATDAVTTGTHIEFGDAIKIYIRQGQIQLNEVESLQACPITDQGCNNIWEYYSDTWYFIELKINSTHVTMKRTDTGRSITKELLSSGDISSVTTVPGSSIVEYKDIFSEKDIVSPYTCTYETCNLDVSYREICSDIIRNIDYPSLLEPKHNPLTTCSDYFDNTRVFSDVDYQTNKEIYELDWEIYCNFYDSLQNEKGYTPIPYASIENYIECQEFVDRLDGNKACINNALDFDWVTSCQELLEAQIPETIKTNCPKQCYNHLLNYTGCSDMFEIFSADKTVIDSCDTDWYDYCLKDSKGTLEGICSAVECGCDYEQFEGVSGESCQLHCPVSSDSTACAEGRNLGKCIYTEKQKNKIENGNKDEYGNSIAFDQVWALEGDCQCFLSEGTKSCDIECYQCNNDTYPGGQNGICDNTRGVCDCLPPFVGINEYEEMNWRGKMSKKIEKVYNTGNITGRDLFRIRMMQGKEPFTKYALETAPGVLAYDGIIDWETLFYDFVDKPEKYWCLNRQCDYGHTILASNLDYSSSKYNFNCESTCPGTNDTTLLPCSGRGKCGVKGDCVCDQADIIFGVNESGYKRVFQLTPGNLITETDLEISALDRTGYRGDACEIKCRGYDEDLRDMSTICSGHGTCDLGGECACVMGYLGDDCEFKCPGFKEGDTNICNGHGNCRFASLVRIDEDLYYQDSTCEISTTELDCITHAEINNLNFEYELIRADYLDNPTEDINGEIWTILDNEICIGSIGVPTYGSASNGQCSFAEETVLIMHESFPSLSYRWDERALPCAEACLKWFTQTAPPQPDFGSWTNFSLKSFFVNNHGKCWCSDMASSNPDCGMTTDTNIRKYDIIFPETDLSFEFNDGTSVEIDVSEHKYAIPKLCATKMKPAGIVGLIPAEASCFRRENTLIWGNNSQADPQICATSLSKQADVYTHGPLTRSLQDNYCGDNKFIDRASGDCRALSENPIIDVTFYNDRRTAYEQKETVGCIVKSNTSFDCIVCECFKDSDIGFWGNLFCSGCDTGYGNKQCSKECPGGKSDMCNGEGICLYGTDPPLNDLFQTAECVCGSDPNTEPKGGDCSIKSIGGNNEFFNVTDQGSGDGSQQNYLYYKLIPGSNFQTKNNAEIACCEKDNPELITINGYCIGVYQTSSSSDYILAMGVITDEDKEETYKIWFKEHESMTTYNFILKDTDMFRGILESKLKTCNTLEDIVDSGVDICAHYDHKSGDCSLCEDGFTGKDCSILCQKCLLGGVCTSKPSEKISPTCECPSVTGIWESNCCPTGFRIANLLGYNSKSQSEVDKIKIPPTSIYDPLTSNQLDAGFWCKPCPGVSNDDWLDSSAYFKVCLGRGQCKSSSQKGINYCECVEPYSGEACACEPGLNVPFVNKITPYGCPSNMKCINSDMKVYIDVWDPYWYKNPHYGKKEFRDRNLNNFWGGEGGSISWDSTLLGPDQGGGEIDFYNHNGLSQFDRYWVTCCTDWRCADVTSFYTGGCGGAYSTHIQNQQTPGEMTGCDGPEWYEEEDCYKTFCDNNICTRTFARFHSPPPDDIARYKPWNGGHPEDDRGYWLYKGYISPRYTKLKYGFGSYAHLAQLHYEDYERIEQRAHSLVLGDIVVKIRDWVSTTYGSGLDYTYEKLSTCPAPEDYFYKGGIENNGAYCCDNTCFGGDPCLTWDESPILPTERVQMDMGNFGDMEMEEVADHCHRLCESVMNCEFFTIGKGYKNGECWFEPTCPDYDQFYERYKSIDRQPNSKCIEQIPCHIGEGPCLHDYECGGDLKCLSGEINGFDITVVGSSFKYCAPDGGYEGAGCTPESGSILKAPGDPNPTYYYPNNAPENRDWNYIGLPPITRQQQLGVDEDIIIQNKGGRQAFINGAYKLETTPGHYVPNVLDGNENLIIQDREYACPKGTFEVPGSHVPSFEIGYGRGCSSRDCDPMSGCNNDFYMSSRGRTAYLNGDETYESALDGLSGWYCEEVASVKNSRKIFPSTCILCPAGYYNDQTGLGIGQHGTGEHWLYGASYYKSYGNGERYPTWYNPCTRCPGSAWSAPGSTHVDDCIMPDFWKDNPTIYYEYKPDIPEPLPMFDIPYSIDFHRKKNKYCAGMVDDPKTYSCNNNGFCSWNPTCSNSDNRITNSEPVVNCLGDWSGWGACEVDMPGNGVPEEQDRQWSHFTMITPASGGGTACPDPPYNYCGTSDYRCDCTTYQYIQDGYCSDDDVVNAASNQHVATTLEACYLECRVSYDYFIHNPWYDTCYCGHTEDPSDCSDWETASNYKSYKSIGWGTY